MGLGQGVVELHGLLAAALALGKTSAGDWEL